MFSQEFFLKIIFLPFLDSTDILTTLIHVLLLEKILLVDCVPNIPLIAEHIHVCKKASMYFIHALIYYAWMSQLKQLIFRTQVSEQVGLNEFSVKQG